MSFPHPGCLWHQTRQWRARCWGRCWNCLSWKEYCWTCSLEISNRLDSQSERRLIGQTTKPATAAWVGAGYTQFRLQSVRINTSETRIRRRWADTAHSLTHWPTDSLTHWLTHSLTRLLHWSTDALTSPHLTSPHLTSPQLTSPHLTSPHLTATVTATTTIKATATATGYWGPPRETHRRRFHLTAFTCRIGTLSGRA